MSDAAGSSAPDPNGFLSRAQEGIGSRFQSQASIEKANEQREKDWKEAYARLGQEPPKQETNYVHDGRTLYERLELNKKLNEEEWDQKMKLGNQYRGLDTEETGFLNARRQEALAKERAIKEEEQRGLAEYRQALAARIAAAEAADEASAASPSSSSAPGITAIPSSSTISKPTIKRSVIPAKAGKKDVKSLMKGVVVKKKAPTASPVSASAPASKGAPTSAAAGQAASSTAATASSSGKNSGTATPTSMENRQVQGKTLVTRDEIRNSDTVGAAGMTALGKRLVQDDSGSESEGEEEAEAEAEAEGRSKVSEEGGRGAGGEKRARIAD